jgi:hypothetical protein
MFLFLQYNPRGVSSRRAGLSWIMQHVHTPGQSHPKRIEAKNRKVVFLSVLFIRIRIGFRLNGIKQGKNGPQKLKTVKKFHRWTFSSEGRRLLLYVAWKSFMEAQR